MKKYIYSGVLTFLFMGVVLVPSAQAETTTGVTSMLEQIKVLMAKVEELQKQLATIRGEIKEVIRTGVTEGMEGDDVEKIQELLATDSTIYPEGRVTGYFGPLTKEAIKRLQARHELEITGVIDDATHDLLESYLKERFGEQIPPGLLRAPGIAKKVEIRIKEGCDNSGHGKALFCQKLKIKYEDEDDDEDDSDDDSDEEETEFEVEVEIEDGSATSTNATSTTVTFTFEGKDYSVEVESTDVDDVLEAVADELDTTVGKLDRDLKNEIKKELTDELDDEDDDSDDDSDEDEND
jgi:peptidoglycan hydrolase-like protein with peptidoglycan-binding domain